MSEDRTKAPPNEQDAKMQNREAADGQEGRDLSAVLGANVDPIAAEVEKAQRRTPQVRRMVQIGIAVICVIVLSLGAWAITTLVPEPEVEGEVKTTLTKRNADDVTKMVITGSNGTVMTMVPGENGPSGDWMILEMEGQMIEPQRILSLKRYMANLVTEATVIEDTADLAQFGLETPQSIVTVTYKDGETFTLELGNQFVTNQNYYAKLPNSNTVYALPYITGMLMEAKPTNYRELSLFSVNGERGTSLEFVHRGEAPVLLKAQYDRAGATYSSWVFETPYKLEASGTSVTEFTKKLASIFPSSMVAMDVNLADYGLDDPELLVHYIDYNGNEFYMEFGDYNPEGTHRYVRVAPDTNEVFLVYKDVADTAFTSTVTLLDWFTNLVTAAATDKIEIQIGATKYTMHAERTEQIGEDGKVKLKENGDIDYIEHFFLDGKEVDSSDYRTAFQTIVGITMNGAVDEKVADNEIAPAVLINYTLNKTPFNITVEYRPYDIVHYAVSRDGERGFYVRKDAVDKIQPALEALAKAPFPKPSQTPQQ